MRRLQPPRLLRLHRDVRGLAVLEMALIMPLVLIFVMLIADTGLLFFNGVGATNAVREGARCAVVGHSEDAILSRIDEASTYGAPIHVEIRTFAQESGSEFSPWTSAGVGDELTIVAHYEHPWILPVDGLIDGLTSFQRSVTMRIEATPFEDTSCGSGT
jgi:hypothetical protein